MVKDYSLIVITPILVKRQKMEIVAYKNMQRRKAHSKNIKPTRVDNYYLVFTVQHGSH